TSTHDRRRVFIDRALAVRVRRKDFVDLLPVERAAIEAYFIKHSCERIALARDMSEMEIVACLRSETSEAVLGNDYTIDVEFRPPAGLVVSHGVMAPANARSFAARYDFMAHTERVDNYGMKFAVILILVNVDTPGAAVVVSHQHRPVAAVGGIGPQLHRERAVLRDVEGGTFENSRPIVGAIETESSADLSVGIGRAFLQKRFVT